MITMGELCACGYVQYPMGVSGYALFLLQKQVDDEKGIKYHINIDVYGAYPNQEPGTFNFQPEVQFTNFSDTNPTVNMTYITDKNTTLSDIEDFFERAWEFMGKPYYERVCD